MKRIKTIAGICILIALGAALGGCVVVPYRGGHGGYYHDRR